MAAPSSDPGAKNLHELHPFPRPSQLRFSPLARPATTGTCSLLWTEHSPELVCRRAEKRAGELGTCVTDPLHLFRCLLRKHIFRENLFWPACSPTLTAPLPPPSPHLVSSLCDILYLILKELVYCPSAMGGPGTFVQLIHCYAAASGSVLAHRKSSVNSVLAESLLGLIFII